MGVCVECNEDTFLLLFKVISGYPENCNMLSLVMAPLFSIYSRFMSLFCRHDVLEGVGKLHLKLLLSNLIDSKYITLDELNEKIIRLDYG